MKTHTPSDTRPAVLLALVLFLSLPQALRAAEGEPSGAALGWFKLTYYYVAEETRGGSWPLYGPACRNVLARTSRAFHFALSREGTGRLRDGRILNFAERCACARPGHGGSRICYQFLDGRRFPWGSGGRVDGEVQPLRPFRSLAVDPAVLPLGSVLYIPAWVGIRAPNGESMDGCLRAVDTGRLVKGRHLDLFAGRPRWAESFQAGHAAGGVSVYRGGARCRDAFPR